MYQKGPFFGENVYILFVLVAFCAPQLFSFTVYNAKHFFVVACFAKTK